MAETGKKTGSLAEGKRLYTLRRWDSSLHELLNVDANKLDPTENAELAYYIGLVHTKMGRYDEGLVNLEQVITAGNDPLRICQCRLAMAYIYVVTGRAQLAEFELRQLIKKGFESAQIYTTMAYAAWLQKNNDRAVELYEKALDLDQHNTTAMNGLGFVLVDANIDLYRGLRYCRQAAERKPTNAAYLDSLGWAYYQCGDMGEARQWLRRAQEIAPHNDDIKKHMRKAFREKT
ncbi:MAG: tetratricopeptide repeat protein [Spirochaetaceae bacterium]|jgi:Tfp pilus assembly protein PilF|nr:tetratricopeptide repeat protein [Spirochaetaceae bacterium]